MPYGGIRMPYSGIRVPYSGMLVLYNGIQKKSGVGAKSGVTVRRFMD